MFFLYEYVLELFPVHEERTGKSRKGKRKDQIVTIETDAKGWHIIKPTNHKNKTKIEKETQIEKQKMFFSSCVVILFGFHFCRFYFKIMTARVHRRIKAVQENSTPWAALRVP